MNNISLTIRELINEVFSETDYLSNDDMAFKLLNSIRKTALEDMKINFKHSVLRTLEYNLLYHTRHDDHIFSNRQLPESYVDKIVNKSLELLSLKILNANDSIFRNGMGEFLYEGYELIEVGLLVSNEIFIKESIGMKETISGRVVSKRIQKVKGEKDFAYLTVDDFNDGPKLNLLVPTKLYQKYKNELDNIEGKSIGVYGEVQYNKFLNTNIIKAFDLEIPDGYIIERKLV